MTFGESVRTVFSKYADFNGRAARSEYWWFTLFAIIANIILNILDTAVFGTTMASEAGNVGIFSALFSLAIVIPSIAVAARRLHDVNRSGWWLLLYLTGIGVLLLLYWYVQRGTTGSNEYGPDPLA